MTKKESPTKIAARASANFLRIAPRKVRAVADMVRGKSVTDAEAQLMHEPRRSAGPILKLIRSAAANAMAAKKVANADQLRIAEIYANKGPMLKRFLPRARGSASEIQKKMSHLNIVLVEDTSLAKPRFEIVRQKAKSASSKKAAAKAAKDKKTSENPAEHEKKQLSAKEPKEKINVAKRVFRRKQASAGGE